MAKQQSQLSTQPYRGTKDCFPEDQRLKDFIFGVWTQMAKRFCYENYSGPFLEPIELYLSKTSEEIVNEQLYHVHDKGERHLAIRPEMTPTLARMVASKQKQLTKPIRWYSIATCMRYERPQRSRLRQFDQFNLDVLGDHPRDEDVEVLLTIAQTMSMLGAKPGDYEIKINHRSLVNDFLESLNITGETQKSLLRLLDSIDKMSPDSFLEELDKLGVDRQLEPKLRAFMQADFDSIKEIFDASNEHLQYIQSVIEELKTAWPEDADVFRFSPGVMRGFDYYTGLVFEVFDRHPENHRALFGGGRYDNLVGSFQGEALSGVGYGVSDISLINFMNTHSLLPSLSKPVDVLAFHLTDASKPVVSRLAMALRQRGVKVEQTMGSRKAGKLFAQAAKLGAKACIFVGEQELSEHKFAIKWLSSSDQEVFDVSEIDAIVAKLQA